MIGDKNPNWIHAIQWLKDSQTGNTKSRRFKSRIIFETLNSRSFSAHKANRGEVVRVTKSETANTRGQRETVTWSIAGSFYTHVHKYIRGTFWQFITTFGVRSHHSCFGLLPFRLMWERPSKVSAVSFSICSQIRWTEDKDNSIIKICTSRRIPVSL